MASKEDSSGGDGRSAEDDSDPRSSSRRKRQQQTQPVINGSESDHSEGEPDYRPESPSWWSSPLWNSHFGHMLQSAPPILERVFSHLPMKDLNRCSQVCRSWNQVARIIKRRRYNFLSLFWARKRLPPPICSACSITEHVRIVVKTAWSQPKLGLLFVTNTFFDEQGRHINDEAPSEQKSVIDHLVSVLPNDCLLLGTCSSGIVGTTIGIRGLNRCCVEVEGTEAFSCLLLPTVPGMDVYPFVIRNYEELAEHEDKEYLSDAELTALCKVPAGQDVKCLLLFCNHVSEGEKGARLLAHTLLRRQNYRMALGGGFVDSFVAPRCMLSSQAYLPHTMGIAICGERVRAASIILQASVNRRKTVEQVLAQLKACHPPTKNSFALMFACVGRGIDHYGEANVEASAFQKTFPGTPLYGLFGIGEIGIDYLPKATSTSASSSGTSSSSAGAQRPRRSTSSSGSPSQEETNIFHGYTTIIVLVSVEKS